MSWFVAGWLSRSPDYRVDLLDRGHRAHHIHRPFPPQCPWTVPAAVLLLQRAALLERVHRSPEAVVLCRAKPAILGGSHAGIGDEVLVLLEIVEDFFPE